MKRVIDDTLLYAANLEKAFTQVAEYFTLLGKNGIILNPEKFSFGKDEVDWAGITTATRGSNQELPSPREYNRHEVILGTGKSCFQFLCNPATFSSIQRTNEKEYKVVLG